MTQYVQAKIETYERPVTAWAVLAVAVALVCAYAYFVNGAIASIVSAKAMQEEKSSLASAVGELEGRYLAAKSAVDLDYLIAMGFKQSPEETVYIAKKPTGDLSFNR